MTDSAGQSLFDRSFYDARYHHGYMEEWPEWKTIRIMRLIRELNLPAVGCALDFGCGRGGFTEALWQALPGWTITGTDISEVALERAKRKLPQHRFIPIERVEKGQYDFLLTHHVLEHVPDLDQAWEEMCGALKPRGVMLHVMPCGNEGSLEYRLCELRRDGFQKRAANECFFFDDESHMRRMKSRDLVDSARRHGCHPLHQWFANQKYGSMDWITDNGAGYVRFLCAPAECRDERARRSLETMQRRMLGICRVKALDANLAERLEWARRNPGMLARLKGMGWVMSRFLATLGLRLFKRQVKREWEKARDRENGSESYIVFQRSV